MKSFGVFLRKTREEMQLPLRKVAAALEIDTSILSKIERNERRAAIEMLPVFQEIFDKSEIEVQVEFIKSLIISDLGDLEYLEFGLKEAVKTLK